MSDLSQTGGLTELGKQSATGPTAFFTASGTTTVRSLVVVENAGSTPNLTIEIYDTANAISYYPGATNGTCWKAKAVTANQAITFNQEFVLPALWALRITSSDAAGKFDWFLTYDNPVAAARLRGGASSG